MTLDTKPEDPSSPAVAEALQGVSSVCSYGVFAVKCFMVLDTKPEDP